MAFGSSFVLATLFLVVSGVKQGHSQVCRPDQVVDHWQNRLHLDEWHIRVSLATQLEMGPEMLGEIEYHEEAKIALIRILDSSERPSKVTWRECENTVLHELIHLMLSRVMPPVDTDEEERVVADLTEAFLASERFSFGDPTKKASASLGTSKHAANGRRESNARFPTLHSAWLHPVMRNSSK
jgi:hypothetical protein